MGKPIIFYGTDAKMLPQGDILSSDGLMLLNINPSRQTFLLDDFVQATLLGDLAWSSFTAGAGATSRKLAADATGWGVIQFDTGTTSTGRQGIVLDTTTGLLLGGGRCVIEGRVRWPQLSTTAEEFISRYGLHDSTSTGEPVDGVKFKYDRAGTMTSTTGDTHTNTTIDNLASVVGVVAGTPLTGTNIPVGTTVVSVDSPTSITISQAATGTTVGGSVVFQFGNWLVCTTSSNSARTHTCLNGYGGVGVAAVVANTWYRVTAEINSAASSVIFKVNGTTVATHSTNIPSGAGRHLGPSIVQAKNGGTVGTTATLFDVDYWYAVQTYTTPR